MPGERRRDLRSLRSAFAALAVPPWVTPALAAPEQHDDPNGSTRTCVVPGGAGVDGAAAAGSPPPYPPDSISFGIIYILNIFVPAILVSVDIHK